MPRRFSWLFLIQMVCVVGSWAQDTKGLEPVEGGGREASSKRLALLVGNARYQYASHLKNPENDVEVMERTLVQAHFDVIRVTNADLRQLRHSLDSFAFRLQEGKYGVGLYYFSGHGMEVDGLNYLLPVEANPKSPADVRFDCFEVQRVLEKMEEAGVSTKILILDACRDNPLGRSWSKSAGGGGLANMNAPEGTFIGYATKPGSVALDGTGPNSPYTTAMAMHLLEPDLSIYDVFTKVANTTQEISKKAGRLQIPFISASLTKQFYLVGTGKASEGEGRKESLPPMSPFQDPLTGRLVLVEGGSFWMGCDSLRQSCQGDDLPLHQVSLDSFYLGETEVTVAQFSRFVKESKYQTDAERGGGSYIWNGNNREKKAGVDWSCDVAGNKRPVWEEHHPVIHVSWNDAVAYVNWLRWKTNLPYRLPTEAEWEYAARGGRAGADSVGYAGSAVLAEVAWFHLNSDGKTHPVREKKPNSLGIYDLNGNVWEWCSDWYSPIYPNESQKGPNGPPNGTDKVNRGGSWRNLGPYCNSIVRSYDPPDFRGYPVGFRLARSR